MGGRHARGSEARGTTSVDSFYTVRVSERPHYTKDESDMEELCTEQDKFGKYMQKSRLSLGVVLGFKVRNAREFVHQAKASAYECDGAIVTEAQFTNSDWGLIKDCEGCYFGQILTGKRHGLGTQIWRNGRMYQGTWAANFMDGIGCLRSPNGEIYEGHWEHSEANGHGSYKQSHGLLYIGSWARNTKQGYGEETSPEGHVYKGEFKAGQKHGEGVLRLKDGSQYRGAFAENLYDGQGQYTWADGRVYIGSWKAGVFEGLGAYIWPTAQGRERYSGEYEAGLKEGFGTLIWADGSKYRGEWSKGLRHGTGLFKDTEEIYWQQVWEQGVLLASHQLNSH